MLKFRCLFWRTFTAGVNIDFFLALCNNEHREWKVEEMKKLSQLEPVKVFEYFEEISGIPRGSGDTKRISDYCVEFAKNRGLEYHQDGLNNIIIIKEASKGYENVPPVIIQGHLDMVCEKKPGSTHDFSKDGLELVVDGDFVSAKNTTLGADDGIAIAYALALLDDEEISHPRLEVIFSVDEETGMDGAHGLDMTPIKGKRLLNIDSEEENILLTSCAGGLKGHCCLPVEYAEETRVKYQVSISGLIGGHSGTEIDKCRANSNKLMGRLLHYIDSELCFGIISLAGGQKDNAIPRETSAELFIDESDTEIFEEIIAEFDDILRNEYKTADPGIRVACKNMGLQTGRMLSPRSREIVIFMIMNAPNGIQSMSADIPGLVETSLNMGVLKLEESDLRMIFAVRSSIRSAKEALSSQLKYLTEFLGGEYTISGDYPGWEFKKDSEFRKLMVDIYRKQYGAEPQIQAIHAGLECGILCSKKEDLDIVSAGPDIFDIHTTEERLSISSVQRFWDYLLEILKAGV